MNKRVVAAACGILLLASLASCGKNNAEETTTAAFPLTGATASTLPDSQLNVTASVNSAAPTYILTTQQGQTMVTVPTTAFSLEAIPSSSVSIPNDFTNPNMTTPYVNTSIAPTVPTTAPTTERTTAPTTQETTEEPTTAAEKVRKYVDLVASGTDPSTGNFLITFEATGWDGGIKSNTAFITVDIDGKKRTAKATVNGTLDVDGNATIKIMTGEYEPGDGSVISCDIPAGFVTSKNGNQTSVDFSTSATHSTS